MTATTGKLCRGCGREFSTGEQFCPDDGSRLSTPSQVGHRKQVDPLIGQRLDGRYQILRVIGEGGMGVVYEAEHVLIEKRVAIKVLRETFTSRPDVVERFRQEAKSASKIGHPNIVDVSDFGETLSGQSYIVMEMLAGEDLADVLARERVLSPARAARLVFQVARALHATHNKNIVHRDLKPENVYLIERDGAVDIVKVVDFGVAKMNDVETPAGRRLTRTGMIFGTPEYMSPEQALGKPFDHRVDIYALGAIFFELLTGRVPFEGDNFMEILAKHGHARVPTLREANPSTQVSPELERVVMRSLSKEPAQRYQSMGELAADLRNAPEMPSLEPGDALEPPIWALTATAPSTPLPNAQGPQAAPAPTPAAVSSTPPVSIMSRGRRRQAKVTAGANRARRVRRLLWVAAAVSAVCIGAGYGWRRAREPSVTLSSLAPHLAVEATRVEASSAPAAIASSVSAATVSSVPAATASSVPAASASPVPQVAQERVEVQIRTQPIGASVHVLGSDLRCAAAPCSLALPRGRPVTLRAQSHNASAERTLTFDDNGAVELHLSAIPRVKSSAVHRSASTKSSSDLKVPAIFRER
jgi:serine/threonine protein kinase